MKKFLLQFSLALISFSLSSMEIFPAKKIGSFSQLEQMPLITKGQTTIIFYDLDSTLFKPAKNFLTLHWNQQIDILNTFRLDEEINGSDLALRDFLKYITSAKPSIGANYPSELVEPQVIKKMMDDLHKNGAIQLGLTARKSIIADLTTEELLYHGIDFSKLSGLPEPSREFKRGLQNEKLEKGIFFTCNTKKKVNYIESLIKEIKLTHPCEEIINVHFIDDSKVEIEASTKFISTSTNTANAIRLFPYRYARHIKEIKTFWLNFDQNYEIVLQEILDYLDEYIEYAQEQQKDIASKQAWLND